MIFIIADSFFHFVWWTYTCNCFLFSGGFFFHKENYSFSCMKEKYSSEGMKYCKKLTWSTWQTNNCLFNKAVFRGNSFFKTLLKFTLSSFACFKKFNFFFWQVLKMESLILKTLGFEVCAPTILNFLERFLKAAECPEADKSKVESLAKVCLDCLCLILSVLYQWGGNCFHWF